MSAIGINLSLGNPVDHIGKIESIDFSVCDRGATLVANIRIKDHDSNFRISINVNDKPPFIMSSLQRQTRELSLQELEKEALLNLLVLQSQNLIISETIKDCLKLIESFDVAKILESEEYRYRHVDDSLPVKEALQIFAESATKYATMLEEAIGQSFSRLNDRLSKLAFDVFDRSEPITEAHKQLTDNLQKQYVLVVNTQFEMLNTAQRAGESYRDFEERKRSAVPTHELAERVKDLINSL
jgi:hypothetical protein